MAEKKGSTAGLVKTLLILVGAIVLYMGISMYHMSQVMVPHSYAAWTTGDLIVEYLKTHGDKWPQDWVALKEAKESLVRDGKNIYWDFDKLPAIVKVDWKADMETLVHLVQGGHAADVKVVTQLDGSPLETAWGPDTEPNQKIARYLAARYSATNAIAPVLK